MRRQTRLKNSVTRSHSRLACSGESWECVRSGRAAEGVSGRRSSCPGSCRLGRYPALPRVPAGKTLWGRRQNMTRAWKRACTRGSAKGNHPRTGAVEPRLLGVSYIRVAVVHKPRVAGSDNAEHNLGSLGGLLPNAGTFVQMPPPEPGWHWLTILVHFREAADNHITSSYQPIIGFVQLALGTNRQASTGIQRFLDNVPPE